MLPITGKIPQMSASIISVGLTPNQARVQQARTLTQHSTHLLASVVETGNCGRAHANAGVRVSAVSCPVREGYVLEAHCYRYQIISVVERFFFFFFFVLLAGRRRRQAD